MSLPLLHKKNLIAGCPPLRAKNLQGVGSDKVPAAIAKMVVPKIVAYQEDGIDRVIVCFDREQRSLCAGQLALQVHAAVAVELGAKCRSAANIHVVVSDRTFEAWLLADSRGLHAKGLFVAAPAFHHFEGELGQSQKKGVVELEKLLGRPYVKTKDGPRLFEKLDFPSARRFAAGGQGSRSLDKLLRVLGL